SCRLGRGHICRQGCHPVAQRALFPEGFVRPTGQATWLVPPRWRASQLRDSAGVGPDFAGRWARGHGTSRVGGGPPRPLAGAASIRPARLPDMSDADVDDDRPAVQGTVEAGFEGVRAAFEQNFVRHGEVGAAFALYVDGRKVVDLWGGVADAATGAPYAEDTLQLVFSSTKGATALCANLLAQRGELDLDAPVAAYWPEFARGGKADVPVRWLLNHKAGLPFVERNLSLDEALAWDPPVEALAAQTPVWEPGTAHGYHAVTYGWLVGEVEIGRAHV